MTESQSKSSLRISFLIVLLVSAGGLWTAGVTVLPRWLPQPPTTRWEFGAERKCVEPFAQVPAFDEMRLTLDLPFPAYVYVVGFDYMHGTVGYFPTEYLATDLTRDLAKGDSSAANHLSAGRHQFPGTIDGKAQAWFVPEVDEGVSMCVIVSRRPLSGLDASLKLVRQMGNTAFPDKSMGYYMPRAGRDKVIGRTGFPHAALIAAQHQPDALGAGPMVPWEEDEDVFIQVFNILPTSPRDGKRSPDPFQRHLREMVAQKKTDDGAGK